MSAPQVGLEPTTLRLTVGGQGASEQGRREKESASDCTRLHPTAEQSPDKSPSGARRGRYTPTSSGDATLCTLGEEEASALVPGDLLVTPWPTGWLPLVVIGVRQSAGGDAEGRAVPCLVVDAHAAVNIAVHPLLGRRLAFAPDDLLRIAVLEPVDEVAS